MNGGKCFPEPVFLWCLGNIGYVFYGIKFEQSVFIVALNRFIKYDSYCLTTDLS